MTTAQLMDKGSLFTLTCNNVTTTTTTTTTTSI